MHVTHTTLLLGYKDAEETYVDYNKLSYISIAKLLYYLITE